MSHDGGCADMQNGPRLSRTRAVPSYPLVISVPPVQIPALRHRRPSGCCPTLRMSLECSNGQALRASKVTAVAES
jgi:hypothetical protein